MPFYGVGHWCNLKDGHCICRVYYYDREQFICEAEYCKLRDGEENATEKG